MTDSDGYVRIAGRVKQVREKSFLFAVGESVERAAWIPRSCIHGADDLTLDGMMANQPATLRIREWKADAEGLTGSHQAAGADNDLFT